MELVNAGQQLVVDDAGFRYDGRQSLVDFTKENDSVNRAKSHAGSSGFPVHAKVNTIETMIKSLFQTHFVDRHHKEFSLPGSCLVTSWWRSARIVLFPMLYACLGCFIGFESIRAVCAQDVSANPSAPTQRPDLKPTRFWFSATSSTSGNTWDTPAPEVMSAVILDINEQEIIYASEKDTTATRLPSARLQAIDVHWASDSGRKSHAAFVRDDFKGAIELSKKAIASGELPRWQQRILAAELTECLTNLEKTSIACSVFVSLCKESPAPMLFASAPLNWTSQRADTTLIQQTKEWLGPDKEPISQLLAASWLLIGSDESQSARSTLEKLSRSKSAVISQLATAQLWRVSSPDQVIQQYSTWSVLRDRMPLPLQVGPTIALAYKLEKAGQSEAALQEWLRVVSVFSVHHKAFDQARDAAIELLKRLGRNDEAKLLALVQRRD